MHNRRDFLKFIGGAFGTVWLSGCGSGDNEFVFTSGSGASFLPTSYRLTTVIGSGQPLPGGSQVLISTQSTENKGLPFPGGLLVNNRRQLFFHATDGSRTRGIYHLDLNSSSPLDSLRKVIRIGDTLPDGRVVSHFFGGDLNNDNEFLVVVRTENSTDGLYLSRQFGPLVRVLSGFQELSSGINLHGNLKGTATLHDNADILFTSNFYDPSRQHSNSQGLFFMPRAQASDSALLLAVGDLLPDLDATVNTIGHSQLHSRGRFVVHGAASPLTSVSTNAHLTYALRGRVGEDHQLLAFHPDLPHDPAIPAEVARGASLMSPRLGEANHSTVVHSEGDRSEFRVGGQVVYHAEAPGGASLSPRGYPIVSILPPVFGPQGLFLVQVVTTQGMELVVGNGTQSATVLARGDSLNGREVNTIFSGALARGANNQGDFVAVVEFMDSEFAVLLGTPV